MTYRIRKLREEVTRPVLLDSIQEMKGEIRRYADRYDVVSPEELAPQLDADETAGWDDLTTWQPTRRVVAQALREPPGTGTGEAHTWGQDERVTHPICVDCAIQTE